MILTRLGVLNAFLTCQLMMGLLEGNPLVSWGRTVVNCNDTSVRGHSLTSGIISGSSLVPEMLVTCCPLCKELGKKSGWGVQIEKDTISSQLGWGEEWKVKPCTKFESSVDSAAFQGGNKVCDTWECVTRSQHEKKGIMLTLGLAPPPRACTPSGSEGFLALMYIKATPSTWWYTRSKKEASSDYFWITIWQWPLGFRELPVMWFSCPKDFLLQHPCHVYQLDFHEWSHHWAPCCRHVFIVRTFPKYLSSFLPYQRRQDNQAD